MAPAIERVLSESVLDQTMRLFWARGYAQTSIEEIVAVTGFNRAAIYNRFGGKRALFLAMLQRYRAQVTARILAPLREPDGGLQALDAFFGQLTRVPELAQQSSGCMLVATASDKSNLDATASTLVTDYVEELTTLIRAALDTAQARGQIASTVEAGACTDFLVGNVLGLMTPARWPAPQTAFHHQIRELRRYLTHLEKGG